MTIKRPPGIDWPEVPTPEQVRTHCAGPVGAEPETTTPPSGTTWPADPRAPASREGPPNPRPEPVPFARGTFDPDCVHCVLAEPLQTFLDSHPDKKDTQILGELLEIAADFAASRVPRSYEEIVIDHAPKLLVRMLRDSFAGVRNYLRARH